MPQERRDWVRVKREAKPLARQALWWWRERLAQLEDEKAAAITDDHLEIERLVPAAAEHYRLASLGADGILNEYLRARRGDPDGTRRLLRTACSWENFCREVVAAVIAKIRREQSEAELSNAA